MDNIDTLHEEISTKIYENVKNTQIAEEIIGDVNELGELYAIKIRNTQKALDSAQRSLDVAKRELDNTVLELEESQRRTKRMQVHLKDLFIVRGYLNKQFRCFWKEHEEKISGQVTDEMLHHYSNRENIYEDAGYKFAVYILSVTNRIPVLMGFSRELCEFYIQLNEKIHPKIVPRSVVVEAIRNLRMERCDGFNITDEILNEIARIV